MVYVVKDKKDGQFEILNRCDAWEMDADVKMRIWARDNGYVIVDVKITAMGDMLIVVE